MDDLSLPVFFEIYLWEVNIMSRGADLVEKWVEELRSD